MPTRQVSDDEEYFGFILSLYNCAHQNLWCSLPCFIQHWFFTVPHHFLYQNLKIVEVKQSYFFKNFVMKKDPCLLCNFWYWKWGDQLIKNTLYDFRTKECVLFLFAVGWFAPEYTFSFAVSLSLRVKDCSSFVLQYITFKIAWRKNSKNIPSGILTKFFEHHIYNLMGNTRNMKMDPTLDFLSFDPFVVIIATS